MLLNHKYRREHLERQSIPELCCSELNPNERHIVANPTVIAKCLNLGNFVSAAKTIGAAIYMMPIADAPIIGMPVEPEKANSYYKVLGKYRMTKEISKDFSYETTNSVKENVRARRCPHTPYHNVHHEPSSHE